MKELGVVVIGRNEGVRLQRCIQSFSGLNVYIVYVDSGSTDNSVGFIKQQGFDVVELDMSIPFSAGRARNAGYQFLLEKYPNIGFLQFVDGDCEMSEGWVETALNHLKENSQLASVCGRRREKYPDATIYNKLCDIEWDTPIGLANATGGDFLCRTQAIVEVNGFSPQVIAGEEPEMCFRIRQKNWEIERLDEEMTLHDAAMTSIVQWWKRSERAGHAYAQGFALHGDSAEKYCRNDVLRIIFWGLLVPAAALLTTLVFNIFGLLILIVYPLKVLQLTLKNLAFYDFRVSLAYSLSLVLCKFPQLLGVCQFYWRHIMGKQFQIIEYKR